MMQTLIIDMLFLNVNYVKRINKKALIAYKVLS